MLDIKKVYIDTRFKTPDSKSDSDFFIELPRSLNVPEDTICYVTDIVIPVSWLTIDTRNNTLYLYFMYHNGTTGGHSITLPSKNYNGVSLAAALKTALNTINTIYFDGMIFDVVYTTDNEIVISQTNHFEAYVYLVSSADLQSGKYWNSVVSKDNIQSMNGILRIGSKSYKLGQTTPYISHIDLLTIRNLYITSSTLASYNTVSNFDNDVIIKKIPVRAGPGQMLFDSADAGYDFLDVSRRALSRIDFRLQDSYGNIVNLRNNHWSFSLVFQSRS